MKYSMLELKIRMKTFATFYFALCLGYVQGQILGISRSTPQPVKALPPRIFSFPASNIPSDPTGAAYNLQRVCNGRQPRNCGEVQIGGKGESGYYEIHPFGTDVTAIVWCDLKTEGGGWTLFQRRQPAEEGDEEDFDRRWNDYVLGFGDAERSFWAGLDVISKLTESGNMELRIEMEDWDGHTRVAEYNSFKVENATSLYRLSVSGFSGDAGDSLSYHNGMTFSTKDRDTDNHLSKHCARDFDGGWWFHECLETNLNGVHYLEGKHISENGIVWKTFHNESYSLKGVRMFLRHKYFNMIKIVAQQLCGTDSLDVNDVEFPAIKIPSPVTTVAPITITTTTPVPTTTACPITKCPTPSCPQPICPKPSCPAPVCPEINCLSPEQFYAHVLPKGCADLWLMNKRSNGVYKIYPDGGSPVKVYCDMTTDEGGWTVFQRRQDAQEGEDQVDFIGRSWTEYESGFGDKSGCFWLGLATISKLIDSGNTELRVELEDWEGNEKFAKYEVFDVADASDNYRLQVSNYSGDAGDSLSYNNNMQFTTKDRDNDKWESNNCAVYWRSGGWWYNSCTNVNLNGRYGKREKSIGGVNWYGFNNSRDSLKRVEMKFRNKRFID